MAGDAPSLVHDLDAGERGAEAVALEVGIHVAALLEERSLAGQELPREPGRFVEALSSVLEVALDGSREAFLAHGRARGLDVGWAERLEGEELWDERARALRGLALASDGIELVPRLLGGRQVTAEDERAVYAHRPERLPGVTDPASQGLDLWEVLLPARLPARLEGSAQTFEGRLGLAFVLGERGWELFRVGFYDVPDGSTLPVPPL